VLLLWGAGPMALMLWLDGMMMMMMMMMMVLGVELQLVKV
jgi:hypothetical protein